MKFGDFRQRDNEYLHHLYWYAMSARSVPTPHTVQVWSIVYRCQGHAKCLLLDKRTSPHFLFILTRHRRWGGHKPLFIMKKFLKNQDGMGSVEIIIILAVLIPIAFFLFKPFVPEIINWIKGLFS